MPAAPGAKLYSGVVNLSARIVMEARAKADDSLLADLTRLIEPGPAEPARFVRLADTVTALYVRVVHGLALLTFLLWRSSSGKPRRDPAAAALLIITCPCALGLAVSCRANRRDRPAVQGGRASQNPATRLKRLAKADRAIFDKTDAYARPSMLVNGDALTPETIEAAANLPAPAAIPLSQGHRLAAGAGQAAATPAERLAKASAGTVNANWHASARLLSPAPIQVQANTTELWFPAGRRAGRAFRLR